MAIVLVLLAEGCEEIEAVTVIDILRRANINVVTASLTLQKQITASRGVPIVADTTLDQVLNNDFDMLILPGGQPGTQHIDADARVHRLIKRLVNTDKWIGAICAAPLVLAHCGMLSGLKVSCYPGTLKPEEWPEIQLSNEAVVCDGKVITSRGPGTAMKFALSIIEKLMDEPTRKQVEMGLVLH